MKIYVDYVFFINMFFDYIILLTESIILKINVSKKRLIISSIVGGLSGFIYFLSISSFFLFLLKILSGFIIIIICFKYKSIKYLFRNFIYLVLISIILGGFLTLVSNENVFIFNKKINVIILVLLSIICSFIYRKIFKSKNYINSYYKVDLFVGGKKYKLNAFIDTGNTLKDPYLNKPVSIISKDINIKYKRFIYVPYNTLSGSSIMKCFFVDKIHIYDIGTFKNVLIGISNDKIFKSGIDIILNNKYMEDI